MNFHQFREGIYELGVFNNRQVNSSFPGFDRKNLSRWTDKGYLLKLRNGYYTFPDYLKVPSFEHYVANQICSPSYISLQKAFEFYELIPESVFNTTSVTTLITCNYKNKFGRFYYQKVRSDLFFGYKEMPVGDKYIMFATLEKAILDYFYLNPFYNTRQDMEELRFDEGVLEKDFKIRVFLSFLKKYKNKALEDRAHMMLNTYNLKYA